MLLASVAHPSLRTRERLAWRLDDLIAARRPFCSTTQAHDLLVSRSRGSAYLDPVTLDLASRLVPLLFARKTHRHHKRWLSIRATSPEDAEKGQTLVIRHPPLLARSTEAPEDGHPQRARNGCILHVSRLLARLGQFRLGGTRPRAVCRAEGGGFVVEVRTDGAHWSNPALVLNSGTVAGVSLASLGWTCEATPTSLRLRAATPEAIIHFSACLLRGEAMDLPAGYYASHGRVQVLLRDFDGDQAELRARLNGVGNEDWVDRLPPLSLDVTLTEAAAIGSWAYLPTTWTTPEVLREVLHREEQQ